MDDIDKLIEKYDKEEKRSKEPRYKIRKYAAFAIGYLLIMNGLFNKLENINYNRKEKEIKENSIYNKPEIALLEEENGIHFLHIIDKKKNTIYLEGINSDIFIKMIFNDETITYVNTGKQKFDSYNIAFEPDILSNNKYNKEELVKIEDDQNKNISLKK